MLFLSLFVKMFLHMLVKFEYKIMSAIRDITFKLNAPISQCAQIFDY